MAAVTTGIICPRCRAGKPGDHDKCWAKLRQRDNPCDCPKCYPSRRRPTVQEAIAERNAALARVDANADPEWKDRALAAVRRLAETRPDLMADDVWDVLDETRDGRALGAIMIRAAKLGLIEKTEEYRPSVRRHRTDMVVWQSLVYVPPVRVRRIPRRKK